LFSCFVTVVVVVVVVVVEGSDPLWLDSTGIEVVP
jgi:hypothetical protein